MTARFGRPLPAIGVAVVATIAVMAIAGWVIAAANSHNKGSQRLSITVMNDRSERVAVQPCDRYFCSRFKPIDLAAGESYTWQTTDGGSGVHSFVVEVAPGGRILGCLAQQGIHAPSGRAVIRVSELERCVS